MTLSTCDAGHALRRIDREADRPSAASMSTMAPPFMPRER